MRHTYAKITFRILLVSFLALMLIGCGESGSPGGSSGPGITSSISLSADSTSLPADGLTSTTIRASLMDSSSNPVFEQTSVVFHTNLGTFRNGSMEYRVKTADTTGFVQVQLITGTTTGTAQVWAESNKVKQKIEVKFYDPNKVGTITLRTGSASISADGTSKVAIIATVTDAKGVLEEGATVNFSTTLGKFAEASPLPGMPDQYASAITDVDGEATVMLVSGTVIGTATILASLDGLNATTSVIFTAGTPKTITMRAAPSLIKPKGTSTVYAVISDINGNPISGQSVVFSQQVNVSEGTLSPISSTTDANGEVQATYTAGKNPGQNIIQGALSSDLGLKTTTAIVVDPGAIVVSSITVTAGSPTLVADGLSKVKIRATVTDIDGNEAIGKTVNFTTTAGFLSPASNTTSDVGLAESMLQATTIAGPAKVRAECDGFIAEVTVTFVPGPADHILMYALPNVVPPNGAFRTAAIIMDKYDNRIDDQRLLLQIRKVGNPTVINSAEMSPDQATNGVYNYDWIAAYELYGLNSIEITARVNNGVSQKVTVDINEDAIIVGSISITAGATAIEADGKSMVAIRAKVLDDSGNPAQGITVDFSTSLGNLLSASEVTDQNGYAEVMLKAGTVWGTATVTADANGFWAQVDVLFTTGKASGLHVTTMPSVVKPGEAATVIAELRDSKGDPVVGELLYFNIYDNRTLASLSAIQATTDTNGRATVTYTAGAYLYDLCAGDNICSTEDCIRVTLASNSAVNATTCIRVAIPTGSVGYLTLTSADNSLPADGASSTAVTATAYDTAGIPMPQGTTISFVTTMGTFSGGIDPDGGGPITSRIDLQTIDDTGKIITSLIASNPPGGVAEITATCAGVSQLLNIVIYDESIAVGSITLTANPASIIADGESSTALTAVVKDTAGNPVPVGTPVVFNTDLGNFSNGYQSIVVYAISGGTVTTPLIAAEAIDSGIAFVTATCYAKTQSLEVPMVVTPLGSLNLTTSLSSLPADGTSTTNLRAIVRDTNGNPEIGVSVTFTTTAGTVLTSPVTTDANGIADSILRAATTAGTATVTASAPSGLSDTIQITFGSGPPETVTVTPVPKNLTADGVSTSTVNFEVRDIDNNPVTGATLVLSVDYGTLSSLSVVTANGKASVTYTAPSSQPAGGIATITATTTNGKIGSNTIALTGTLVASITLTADPPTLPANGTSQSIIRAQVTAVGGGNVPDGTEVQFEIVSGNGSLSPPSATTAAGVAFTFLTSDTSPGTVTIRATAGGRIAEIDVIYTSGSVTLTIIPNSLLGTGVATSEITALVLDVNGNPQNNIPVTLTLSDLTMGAITTANPVNSNVNGEAVFTFTGYQKGGTVKITATTGAPAAGLTASGNIDIQPPPAFIQVAAGYPNPTTINIKGTGGQSTSQIVFEVKDISGNPVTDGYRVDFTILDGPNGGEAIEPSTALTSGGKISTILRSGTKSGPVSIKATYFYNTSVFTVTSQITITSGPPVGEEFGIFAQYLNISGLWKANLQDQITVNVGDIYGNPVPDGTAISFKTYNTGGAASPGSATTLSGLASNTLRSVGTYTPAQGFLTVTAETNNGGRTTRVQTISVTPNAAHRNIVYVGTDGGGVYKSIDYGASWANVSRSSDLAKEAQNYIDPYVNSVCVDPDDYNTVYAATGYLGRGNIYRSIDGGITWLSGNFEKWYGLISTDNAILTLTCDDNASDYVWAGTDGLGAIFAPDGENFQWGGRVSAGPSDPGPVNTGTGTMSTPTLSVTTKSETWTTTYVQSGATVSNLLFNDVSGQQANGSVSNLSAIATASTETWTLSYLGDWGAVSDPGPANTGTGALTVTSIGRLTLTETWTVTCIDITTPGAEKWRVVGSISGLQATQLTTGVNYTIANKLTCYILAGGTPFALGDDFSFTTTADGWDVTGSVSGAQADARTAQAYTSDNSEVSFTISSPTQFYGNGDQWTFDTSVIGNWRVVGSVSGTQIKRAENNISYSTDNGEVSFVITEGGTAFEPGDNFTFTVQESGLGYGKIVRDIVRVPSTNGSTADLYAATAAGVYKSLNGGLTWTVTTRFTGDNITCLAKHPDPALPNVVYAGTEDAGIRYTTNGGTTWIQYNNGLGAGLSASTPIPTFWNVGNGVMSQVSVVKATKTENWTVTINAVAANGGTFDINGSVSGYVGQYIIGTGFSPGTIATNYINFTITDGAIDFNMGDQFTFRTTRDPGTRIKDLVIDSDKDYAYAATYFNAPNEPYHAVGNVYSLSIVDATGAPTALANWTERNIGLPPYDFPDDLTLFPQHVLAIDDPTASSVIYCGGEGINFSKATQSLATGNPTWAASKTGLTNLIMARMPILFTGVCSMNIASIDYDEDTGIYTYKVYIQDANGNPPIVGSNFTVVSKIGTTTTTLLNVDYPDTYAYEGTWSDPTDSDTNRPFIIQRAPVSGEKITFTFTPLCQATVPGCSGSTQEQTFTY